jgi:hypothetical protein
MHEEKLVLNIIGFDFQAMREKQLSVGDRN